MSSENTIKLLSAYEQSAPPTLFLTGLFRSPAENFYESEDVEIDIERTDEDIAIVIQDLSTDYRYNADDIYTNKRFKAPIYKEAIALNSSDLIKRSAGENPFQSPRFRANVVLKMVKGMRKIQRKIARSIEVQAASVLQFGTVTLQDDQGNDLYTIDYSPKTTHFPTSAIGWGLPGATIFDDLNALSEVIRNDGLSNVDQIIMGSNAFENFIKDPTAQQRFDNRRVNMGAISPMQVNGNGGIFRGVVEVGNYNYDVWTYNGRYKDPQTGVKTQYMDPDKVIMRASSGRLDATFGAIPNIGLLLGNQSNNLIPDLPSRMSLPNGSMDLHTNVWLSVNGEQMFGGVGSRPLLIPTAIDTFGTLNTQP